LFDLHNHYLENMKTPAKQPEKEAQLPNPDDVLRRMLATKPKPHKPAPKKEKS
jgi:hypothetical protein